VGAAHRSSATVSGGDSLGHPRTLVVGKGFDQSSGVGITLSSLFRGWPKDRLAAACSRSEASDHTVCDHYYVLGSEEGGWRGPLSRLARPLPSGPLQSTESAKAPQAQAPSQSSGPLSARARTVFWSTVVRSGAEHFLTHRRISPRFAAWVREFRPELLYTHLESLPMMHFVQELKRQLNLPLVIHMMDDWPSSPEHGGLLRPLTRRVMDRELRLLLDSAACDMAISEYMCDAFALRYGHRFVPFHNVVDTESWPVPPRSDWTSSGCFRVVYAGRVGKANEEALRDVAGVVAGLARRGVDICLEIYALDRAPYPPGTWPDSHAVRVLPAVGYTDIPALLVSADLLLLPLSFSAKDFAFARFSMPTKVAEYLASGTPILVYAPEDTALTLYARAAGWGTVVGTRDLSQVTRSLSRLAKDEHERERLGKASLRVARVDQDATRVRSEFAACLYRAAQSGSCL
jgi:glycosyltransferase involved in cell wall biosynthesis